MDENFKKILEKEIATCSRRTKKSKRLSYGLKIGVMFLTLCITIILGLTFNGSAYSVLTRNIALILGAIVTFLSGLMSFWNIEEYFLTNKAIEAKLKALLLKYELYKNDSETLNKITSEFIQIIERRSTFFEEQT